MSSISLEGLDKWYGDFHAIRSPTLALFLVLRRSFMEGLSLQTA